MEHGLLMAPFPTDVEMLALDRRSEMPQGGAGIVRGLAVELALGWTQPFRTHQAPKMGGRWPSGPPHPLVGPLHLVKPERPRALRPRSGGHPLGLAVEPTCIE